MIKYMNVKIIIVIDLMEKIKNQKSSSVIIWLEYTGIKFKNAINK